jgi:hypothetical protein
MRPKEIDKLLQRWDADDDDAPAAVVRILVGASPLDVARFVDGLFKSYTPEVAREQVGELVKLMEKQD